MKNAWLKCHVLKGMFSDERAIVLKLNNGKKFSAFVPRQMVQGEIDHDGKVQVSAFQDGGAWWAVVPNEYREIIAVKQAELVHS